MCAVMKWVIQHEWKVITVEIKRRVTFDVLVDEKELVCTVLKRIIKYELEEITVEMET